MGSTDNATARFSCSVENCTMSFDSQRELTTHEQEQHGELRRCLESGCQDPGAAFPAMLETHKVKEHSEKALLPRTNANSEGPSTSSSQDHQDVTANSQDLRRNSTSAASSNNLKTQSIIQTPTMQSGSGSTRNSERPGKQFEAPPRIYEFAPLPEGSYPRIFDELMELSLEELDRDRV